ncbi:MAG: bile acid:sodium symporter family protein [Cellvibrionaceae bacterium]|nr:bile acid:sodium symporter family protein [Cellvibrionaceae bacterium]
MDMVTTITQIAPLFLAITMFGMGLSLTIADFGRLFKQTKPILIGLGLQVFLLPLLGFLLARVFSLPAALAIGLMVLAACPGGPGSNLISYLSKGEVALSVTLTALSSALAIITVPLITGISLSYFYPQYDVIEFSIIKMVAAILAMTLIPTFIGMITSYYLPTFAKNSERPVKFFAFAFLVLLVLSTFFKDMDSLETTLMLTALPLVLLCATAIVISLWIAVYLELSSAQQKTIAIEVGLQNPVLAVVITGTFLDSQEMAIAGALYPMVMISAALLFIIHAQLR